MKFAMRHLLTVGLVFSLTVQAQGVTTGAAPLTNPAAVDQQRLSFADQDPGQWMSHGRDWTEQRFSPLKQINDKNAARLGLVWYAELNTYRGVDATPTGDRWRSVQRLRLGRHHGV